MSIIGKTRKDVYEEDLELKEKAPPRKILVGLDEGEGASPNVTILEEAPKSADEIASDKVCVRCKLPGHVMARCSTPCKYCKQFCKTRSQCRKIRNATLYEEEKISKKSFLQVSTNLQCKRSRMISDFVKDGEAVEESSKPMNANEFTNETKFQGTSSDSESDAPPRKYRRN